MTSTSTREPVVFENRKGLRLFGIVHTPEADVRRDVAVILLSPGVKSRVAPHRLYNKLAAMMAANGYTVLRFDFYGLGDSEGTIDEKTLADLYGSVQVGRFVDDTIDALDWAAARFGCNRFVLAGLCGGALTGVFAAQHDPRVVGILGLGLPVMLQGSNIDYRRYMTAGQLEGLGGKYLQKVLNPAAWVRLLTFRTDYRLLARAVAVRLRGKRAAPVAAAATSSAPAATTNANPLFPPAMKALLARGCRVLLIFGESDRLYWEFDEKYHQHHRGELAAYTSVYRVDVLPSANHVLTFSEWQHDFLQRAEGWLLSHFAGSERSRPANVAAPDIARRSAVV